jgi:hypothetical protein
MNIDHLRDSTTAWIVGEVKAQWAELQIRVPVHRLRALVEAWKARRDYLKRIGRENDALDFHGHAEGLEEAIKDVLALCDEVSREKGE